MYIIYKRMTTEQNDSKKNNNICTVKDGMIDKNSIIVNEGIEKILVNLSLMCSVEFTRMMSYLQSQIRFSLVASKEYIDDPNAVSSLLDALEEIIDVLMESNLDLIIKITSYVIESGRKIKNNIDFRDLLIEKFLENKIDIDSSALEEEKSNSLLSFYFTSYNNVHLIYNGDKIELRDIESIDDYNLPTTTRCNFYKGSSEDETNIVESNFAKIYYEIFKYFMDNYESSSRFRKTKSARK